MELHPIGVAEMMALDIPEQQWVVEDMLALGSATILPAREKSGKGLICIDLGCCIAEGVPFLDRAVMQGSVVYLALEESIRTIRDRVRKRLGTKTDVPFYVIRADGSTDDRFSLEDPETIAAIIAVVKQLDPVLLIIDTLRESHIGREDSSDDMAPRLRPIRQIAHQLGVTVLVTHHASKMIGGSRGSTAIKASFDDEIAFHRTDEESSPQISGKFRVEGRNVQKNTIIADFNADSGRWVIGNAPDDTDFTLGGRIVRLLESRNVWMTPVEIAAGLPLVKLKTIQNKLPDLLASNQIVASGPGTKGHPRKFSSVRRRLDIDPDDSGNDGGNDETEDWRAA